jgi:hypothetical protein
MASVNDRPGTAWSLLAAEPRGERRAQTKRVGGFPVSGVRMGVVDAILLVISVVVFVYLGIAMFKPEWF